jgi:hypothetical protein
LRWREWRSIAGTLSGSRGVEVRGLKNSPGCGAMQPDTVRQMVYLADGTGVLQMLEKAMQCPERYRRLIVSSPFVDDYGINLLTRLRHSRRPMPRLTLVVTPAAAGKMGSWLDNPPAGTEVIIQERLHAKVYALLGMNGMDHEALITSSNLTSAGIRRNLEVGVTLRGSTERLITTIERVARRVTL